MKRLLRNWAFWAFVALPLLGGMGRLLLREERSSSCRCNTWKRESSYWIGWDLKRSWRLFSAGHEEQASALYEDLLKGRHKHAWSSSSFSRRCVFGLVDGFVSCGIEPAFPHYYRTSPAFRGWMKAKLSTGEITVEDVDRSLASGDLLGWTPP